ncbi:MAG: DUF2796 domain-containing protein [Gammaproteobacteria bacterium]|jgi:hypothetical protein|nr:DUF2796 domain-containing protein [Gammaproteobacteria bacterium]
MKTILRRGLLVVGLAGLGFVDAHEPRREHAAHEHGHASGTLAEDSGQWQLKLELPGYNLVGFEHPPASEEQSQRLEAVRSLLESGRWLQPDPEATCRVASSRVTTSGYGEARNNRMPSGPEAHDHHHGEDSPQHDHGHGAFVVDAVISCDPSRRMRWLAIDLFEGFPDNRSIRLDVLSESGAASFRLAREDFRIEFD